MKGLLEGDRALQAAALKGLIKASKRLGLDPTRYQNALAAIEPAARKDREAKGKKSPKARSPETSGEKETKTLTLAESKVRGKTLTLRFSDTIGKKRIREFVLKRKKSILYVFDIYRVRLPYAIKRIRGEGFKEIRIAQYDPKRVRLVIETTKSYRPEFTVTGKVMKISLPDFKKRKKSIQKRVPSKKESGKPKKKILSKTSEPPSNNSYNATLRKYRVVIDPGHGGKDGGAVGYQRRKEKDAVLAVAKRLKKVLQKRGFNVFLTREKDIFIPLKKRTRMANRKQADFFISIHANAAARKRNYLKNRGIETYYLSPARTERAKRVAAIENSAEVKNIDRYTKDAVLSMLNREKIIESNKLAIDLQRQMLTSLRKKYRHVVDNGVRKGPFWVLVGAQMPAVLIEIGYITNPTEARRIFNPYYQKLLAEGIANGIESYIYHKNGGR
ncbi:N-acetylmuramoyl-L-alanine amidase [Hydrogenimonas urashimensis]|uniref:N-acetylmuramoyl-L-alanine amidase n=1 Tax=Hydrogenimonas urashimensis TaxID=2740515 RepID=UPI0019168488|nr:N-acetylmuramoyl-L-alanine amidase [Hydrogenimonas urashimensis]